MSDPREFFLDGRKIKRRNRKYTQKEKRMLLIQAAPMVKRKIPLCVIAAIIQVPANTFYLWIYRINTEGVSSIINRVAEKGDEGRAEMLLAVKWIESGNRKPTPKNFKEAKYYLNLDRKATSLYIYYRKHLQQQNDDNTR